MNLQGLSPSVTDEQPFQDHFQAELKTNYFLGDLNSDWAQSLLSVSQSHGMAL